MLTNLALITTTRCDLHCQHCLRGYPTQRSDFPVELLNKLLTEAMPFGVKHVGLTGGEPHLHPQFEGIVEKIVSYGYTWHFVSHGQRTKPYLPMMERYRDSFEHVSLSIDGAKAKTHDEIRGRKGAFEKVVKAAQVYLEKGFNVKAGMTLNRINKEEIKQFIHLAEDLGIKHIGFGGTIPADWNHHLILSDKEALELYQQIQELRKETGTEIKTVSALYTHGGVNFCNVLNLRELTFNSNGDLIFCCDTIKSGTVIGSLQDHPFKDLIQKWLAQSSKLQVQRTERIASGYIGERFDTCAFCNHLLK
jgi:MoaA/NifB/PqqE/SkfB family radical SAM enzyme